MHHAWKILIMTFALALSGCAGDSEAPVETAPTTSVDDQVGETGETIEVEPGTAGLSVRVTPTIDQAYIPYRAAFSYSAVIVDADGAETSEPVSVALGSESLALAEASTVGGALGFLVDVAGEHVVTATFRGDGVDDVRVSLDVTGLYDELVASLTTGLETQMLVPHALTYEVTGGLGREETNFTYTCAWEAPDSFAVDGCNATVLADAPGDLPYKLTVSDGLSTMVVEETLVAVAVQATGDIAGSYTCFTNPALAYNSLTPEATVVADDAKPKYVAGVDTLDCQTRFTEGPGIDASTPAYFFVVDEAFNVVHEATATSAGDSSAGTPRGYVYAGTWAIPDDQAAAEYKLLIRLDLGDGAFDWVSHSGMTIIGSEVTGTSNQDASGAALFDVIGAP